MASILLALKLWPMLLSVPVGFFIEPGILISVSTAISGLAALISHSPVVMDSVSG